MTRRSQVLRGSGEHFEWAVSPFGPPTRLSWVSSAVNEIRIDVESRVASPVDGLTIRPGNASLRRRIVAFASE